MSQRLVGKLNYLTVTRPDISFPISVVSQFLSSHRSSHCDVVIRILRYLKGSTGRGLLGFGDLSSMHLWCDNQVVIHIASNPAFYERTKHIELDCHFIHEKLQQKLISINFVRIAK
ncbi:hypothetical protein CFOL_v3_01489 [Cephalotus follicularis]|uniref:RVT_2 domain-containing protein n=1 Tax=Cephalotus follicularis TaxID=3775 RepID=A0A1Q3AQW8_CEPFO|nr:hypothetical protein CFOL_v3_01489 [Cephalotus follicularis]